MNIAGIFRFYSATDMNFDPVQIEVKLKRVGEYVTQKISDLNRKKRDPTKKKLKKKEKNIDTNDSGQKVTMEKGEARTIKRRERKRMLR